MKKSVNLHVKELWKTVGFFDPMAAAMYIREQRQRPKDTDHLYEALVTDLLTPPKQLKEEKKLTVEVFLDICTKLGIEMKYNRTSQFLELFYESKKDKFQTDIFEKYIWEVAVDLKAKKDDSEKGKYSQRFERKYI